MEINKAIIPAGGLGTRFLPLTKILTKELLPVVDKPMIYYPALEAAQAGIGQIIFVLAKRNEALVDLFKKQPRLEKALKARGKKKLLETLREFEAPFDNVSFSAVIQPLPKGDGDAVLKAKKQVGKSAFAVLFCDDLFKSKIPPTAQLEKVFQTAQKPVLGLKKVPADQISLYGAMRVEKIASYLYKIKEIIEKPAPEEAPSDLVFCGRAVLTPEIFGYLEKTPPTKKGEVILVEAWNKMLKDGKIIYGCEIEGEWLQCGNLDDWLKSNARLCLESEKYGGELKKELRIKN